MSYTVSLFAFDASMSDKTIHRELMEGAKLIAYDLPMDQAYVLVHTSGPLKFVALRATGRPPASHASRGTVTEGFFGFSGRAAFLGYDDQSGIHLFESLSPNAAMLLSDGPFLGGDVNRVSVDYPQRGFSPGDLRAVLAKPEQDLTDREYRAVAGYRNAIDIGLEELFGFSAGNAFLQVAHQNRGFDRSGREVDVPMEATDLLAYWPTTYDWTRSGLSPRY